MNVSRVLVLFFWSINHKWMFAELIQIFLEIKTGLHAYD